jgi:putative ABC transport system ATP-binding protein
MENVELPLIYSNVRPQQRRERALAALEKVGLAGRVDHHPAQLSGGEQQRVAIARAIINNPSVILADEPTGALDSRTGAEILALLKELNQQGTSVVVITHNLEIADSIDHHMSLVDGRRTEVEEPSNAG